MPGAGAKIAIFGLLGLLSAAACANPIAIYNTGEGGTPGNADAHWQLVSAPPGAGTTATVVTSYPSAYWTATDPNSQWIAPKADESLAASSDPAGNYTYQTTFDLTGFNPAGAMLTGGFASDNCVVSILINGNATGPANVCGFGSFTSFIIGSGFQAGINTLTFIVSNAPGGATGNPSGLNVLVSGTVAAPEPGSLGLLGLGLLGLVGIRFRRKFA